MHEVSKGKLLRRGEVTRLEIPPVLIDKLPFSSRLLVIFVPRPDNVKITVIPCKTEEILKIVVHLDQFHPETIRSIADIISELRISTVHTSGICFHEKECFYEAYVELNPGRGLQEANVIRDRFSRIEGCRGVDLELLQTT